jgi:hypothetical protein
VAAGAAVSEPEEEDSLFSLALEDESLLPFDAASAAASLASEGRLGRP